ncbi:hypothetical protein YC2023_062698 [Brassica napus]
MPTEWWYKTNLLWNADSWLPDKAYGTSDIFSEDLIFAPTSRCTTHTKSFSMPTGVDTCVFWDVADYPLPLGLQLHVFYENIVSAVRALVSLWWHLNLRLCCQRGV